MDPPRFPEPQFSRSYVCVEAGVGYMLVSQASRRRFFCPESGHCVPTQFGGSVSKCFELTSANQDLASRGAAEDEEEEQAFVSFEGELFRYCPSHPMGLKTCRIPVLKLEAQWQDAALGELCGEVRIRQHTCSKILYYYGIRFQSKIVLQMSSIIEPLAHRLVMSIAWAWVCAPESVVATSL